MQSCTCLAKACTAPEPFQYLPDFKKQAGSLFYWDFMRRQTTSCCLTSKWKKKETYFLHMSSLLFFFSNKSTSVARVGTIFYSPAQYKKKGNTQFFFRKAMASDIYLWNKWQSCVIIVLLFFPFWLWGVLANKIPIKDLESCGCGGEKTEKVYGSWILSATTDRKGYQVNNR